MYCRLYLNYIKIRINDILKKLTNKIKTKIR